MMAIYYRQRESPQNIIKNHGNLDITADYPLLITPLPRSRCWEETIVNL